MIKVVAFDLDDTLWHVEPVIRNAERVLSDWLKQRVPGFRYDGDTLRGIRIRIIEEDPQMAFRMTAMRRRVIEEALLDADLPNDQAAELASAAMEIFLDARNTVSFFDGALETIAAISDRYHLGALTNGNADIHRLGLADHFRFAFSAEEIGAPKPAPDLFEHALSHTGCEPHEMVYVGDDPVKDVDAAKRLGLNTIWYRNTLRPGPPETEPDHVIDQITELPDALSRLDDQPGSHHT